MTANGENKGTPLSEFVGAILELVFHLLFPVNVIAVCGISFLLVNGMQMPEFSFWTNLALLAFAYAASSIWVAAGLAIFVLAALPLAWIAYREQQVVVSRTILQWIITLGVTFGMFWLRTTWPYEDSGWQLFAYGMIMYAACAAALETMLSTLGIVAHVRRSRPAPARPPRQQPHGAPRENRRSSRGDPETI